MDGGTRARASGVAPTRYPSSLSARNPRGGTKEMESWMMLALTSVISTAMFVVELLF